MKRNAIEKLIDWKQGGHKQPFFLSGVRGCGKTYLAMDFAKSFYEGALYLNFEMKNAQGTAFLDGMGQMKSFADVTAWICRIFDVPKEFLDRFLIVLDEVYEEQKLWDFLLSLCSKCGEPDTGLPSAGILMISSRMPELPEFFLHLNLYPLQFDEFLSATGQEWYGEVIRGHFHTNHRVPGIVHEELIDRFGDYLCTGGMPAAVNEYLCFERGDNLPEIHRAYLGHILYDIYRCYGEGEALRMSQVLHILPIQLCKENRKFQYRLIRRGATKTLYQRAIQELCKAQFIRLCAREGYEGSFKAFPSDLGLLHALAAQVGVNWSGSGTMGILSGSREGRGVDRPVLECYVMESLCACGYQPKFWESASQARLDFLIDMQGYMIPVEVKTADNTRSKSVNIYRASHEIPYSLKISKNNFDISNNIRTIPYYAVFCL
ncbi:MAG: AAA family ATPase [Lachnospiraceae bacterium]|nr:AAA family ATPase [Lachnospiraceae bacterium]